MPVDKKISTMLEDIENKRNELNLLSNRINKITIILEEKMHNYLQNSKNLPSIGGTAAVLDTLSTLYKTSLDTNEKIIKSLEKQIELQYKYNTDTTEDDGVKISSYDLLQLVEEALKQGKVVDTNDSETD